MIKYPRLKIRPNGYYYVEVARDDKFSTGTKDLAEAQAALDEYIFLLNVQKTEPQKAQNIYLLLEAKERFLRLREYSLSLGTLKKDRTALKLFVNCIGGEFPVELITSEHIEDFKVQCLERGVKDVSINAYLRHLKKFFNWLLEEGKISSRPRIKMLKEEKGFPKFIIDEKLLTLVKHIQDNYPELFRIVVFASDTGCRISEIVNADFKNFISPTELVVKGKGRKTRIIDLSPLALSVITSPLPKKGKIFDYQADWTSRLFKKACRECGFDDIHFHMLRHTAITNMLQSGMDLYAVSIYAGHSSTAVTQRYAHAQREYIKSEREKMKNPITSELEKSDNS